VGSQSLCVTKTTPLVADLPVIPTLLHDIRANTSDDAFLRDVLQAVLDSDDNFYQDFFWMIIAYCVFDTLRMWWHGYAYRRLPEGQLCDLHMEIVSWLVILALIAQLLPSHTRFIGQGCMLTCHILFDLALRVQLPKVAITNVLGFHNSLLFLFNQLLVGQWT